MIDSPEKKNDQIITDPDSIIFKRTIELSQKEDGHEYKDFKSLNLYYINPQHFNVIDFTKFDKQHDQVNLIIYFNGSHLEKIPESIGELIDLLESNSDFNRTDQIRIFMRQRDHSYVIIAIDILKEILILINKILQSESSNSKSESENSLLSLLEHKLNLREQELGSSPTISSDNSSPSPNEIEGGLLLDRIDSNTSFEPQTPLKINLKFNYNFQGNITFNTKKYNIYNSQRKEITKILRITNQIQPIEDCVKNSIKIAIDNFNGENPDQEALLKSYEYLLIAIHSGGVKHEKIKYKKNLNFLNGDSKRLNYEDAKELSKTFQSKCADVFKIYTGRIPNRQDFELVGMRTKRIPLELLIEIAKENLDEEKFTTFMSDVKKITTNPVTFFSRRGQRQEANLKLSSQDYERSLTSEQSSLEMPEILFSNRKKRISSHLDNEDSQEKINLFSQSESLTQKKESQHLFDKQRISPRKIPRQTPKKTSLQRKKQTNKSLRTKIQTKEDSIDCLKTREEGFFYEKSTSLPEAKLLSIQYSRRGVPKTVFSIRQPIKNEGSPFERLKRDSVTADKDELQNRSQKRFPIIDFSRRVDAQKPSVMK